ncbi:MAG: 2'-5' RNA ligase family protein [Candidatus Hodarchaeota archaeon]
MVLEHQLQVYNAIWEKYSPIIRKGQIDHSQEEETMFYGRRLYNKDNPAFLAVVFKIPSEMIWEPIQLIQAKFEKVDPNQQYHHANYFHITLEELGWEDQVDLDQISDEIEEIVSSYNPFEVKLKGLNCFLMTIFIQVVDQTNSFQRIFEAIHKRFPHLIEKPFDYVPHISIIRILTKGAPTLISLIEKKYRREIIGELSIDQIHIVRAWPYLTVGRIEVVKTILI